MPALIAHEFFGRSMLSQLDVLRGASAVEQQAFLLGNQGPDPLFYVLLSPPALPFADMGHLMHNSNTAQLLAAWRQVVDESPAAWRGVLRAYAAGFMGHYALDSTMHPFVYAQQYALCDAGEPGLTRADAREVHAIIESELDEMLLYTRTHLTVASFQPQVEILDCEPAALRAISRAHAQVIARVYGRRVPSWLFSLGVADYRLFTQLLHSKQGRKREAMGRAEELLRRYSFLRAMSHRPVRITESIFDNHEHALWVSPFTGEESSASFEDLFALAQHRLAVWVPAMLQSSRFTEDAARALNGNCNFSGCPNSN